MSAISDLANHIVASQKLEVGYSPSGPALQLIDPPPLLAPAAAVEAVNEAPQPTFELAMWLIRVDIVALNRAGFDGRAIARRYRSLQAKSRDHYAAWQKAIEQVTALPLAKLREKLPEENLKGLSA